MPEVFCDYARYYDLLYKEKDYAGEAAYIHALIQKFKPGAKTILDLGCGTGKHDLCLSNLGYGVTGVDLSETMLAQARKRTVKNKPEFLHGDIRSADLGRKFDIIISLFHAISYQTTDNDALAAFRTANRHLKGGGLFLFDFWHGEGVLNDLPSARVKHLEDDVVRIVRTAEPVLYNERNMVSVNYRIMATDKKSGRLSELRETHEMRYFFLTELESFLSKSGFVIKSSSQWMSGKELASAWYGLIVSVKKDETEV